MRQRHDIMAEPDFQVVFDGQLVEGTEPAAVKANIAKLFKTEVAKVESLFSGRRTVVKRNLDEATAQKYCVAFERAGAVATVVSPSEVTPAYVAGTSPPAQSPPTPAATAEKEGPSRLEIAEASRAPPPLAARGVPSVPDDMTMADPGTTLVDEPAAVEAPSIDTSHLTLAEVGVDLADYENVASREFDLSAFELAPPGTTLGDGS